MATLINTAQVRDYSNSTPNSMSLPATSLTTGNLIVVAFSTFHFFGAPPTGVVTDTAGNTYTQAIRVADTGNGWTSLQIYFCANAAGHASNVVTVTYGTTSGNHEIASAQYHGIKAISPLDATSSNSSGYTATTTQTTDPFTTSNANDLIIAVFHTSAAVTWTAGTGYTVQVSNDNLALQDKLVASIQTGATSSITASASGTWMTVVATFKGVDQNLTPGGIVSRRAFGAPVVSLGSGFLYPSSVPSRRAFGRPSMAQDGTISPSSVASRRAVGHPAVTFAALLQTLSPSSVPSRRAFGTAGIISGGTQDLLPRGIPSRRAFGFPALLQAGTQPLRVFVGGKNSFLSISPMLEYGSRMGGRSTSSFQLQWPEGSTPIWPIPGQSVKVTENYTTKFVGFLQEVTTEVLAGTNMAYRWDCTAIDLGVIADRRTVDATYQAGAVKPSILDAVARFLDGENITTNNVTTRSVIAQAREFKHKTFTEFMNQLCSETGDIWFIDEFGDLNCFAPGDAGAAPFQIVTGAGATVSPGLKVKRTLIGVATQIFVRSNQDLGS